jgi:hypothetical protein
MGEKDEPPFDGGSRPIREHPPEVATRGRLILRDVAVALAIVALLAAALWILIPILA